MKFRQANGKENRLSFGKYPDVSLEQTRQKRDEARKLKAAEINPAENRKAEKEAYQERTANTFEKHNVIIISPTKQSNVTPLIQEEVRYD